MNNNNNNNNEDYVTVSKKMLDTYFSVHDFDENKNELHNHVLKVFFTKKRDCLVWDYVCSVYNTKEDLVFGMLYPMADHFPNARIIYSLGRRVSYSGKEGYRDTFYDRLQSY